MGVGKNVATIDPLRHAKFRKVMAIPFLPKALADGEARTIQLISEIFDELPDDGEIDLLADLTVRIPMAVICDVLQLPADDWDDMLPWGSMTIRGTDPEFQQGMAAETVSRGFKRLYDSSDGRASERCGCSFSDPLSLLANAAVDGRLLSASEVAHNAVRVILAGFETTRNAVSGCVLALLEHPEQMALLLEDPKRLRLATDSSISRAG